ncbi:hypothetical protein N7495_008063 [Penicillium taxi]|uniref:uncharacterized protein n=1 Tax=Penicillium taxi TaxID=168475 RepID=UPI002545275B|nr:uncharacterized protein N7495_008063 [Penicillium taxi]KAJ5888022.1 hypothetical protein N7495_008063 [Penicillium taxi]
MTEDVSTNEGTSIINLSFIDGVSLYCCGTPIINGSKIVCPYGDSFEIDDGTILAGYAALANVTSLDAVSTSSNLSSSSNSTFSYSTCSDLSSCHDVAIGAGVGVPLGIIALAACAWAFYERSRANLMFFDKNKTKTQEHEMAGSVSYSAIKTSTPGLTELDTGGQHTPELMARE